ncbi:MAG: pentapeptide repeat-containing protein [Nitrospirae bacterium]|nr:pentapeptide repeat-containing protein [Candidatus Manganitrophaceae bacterium]
MALKPIGNNPDLHYHLLREGQIDEFNTIKRKGEKIDLTDCDFRGLDLRGVDLAGLDLSGCFFRQSDLRGIDFSHTHLEGASLYGAKVSGTYFPMELSPEEITLSLTHGSRMRYRNTRG